MSWNFRVMKHVRGSGMPPNGDTVYAVHEVYYNDDGTIRPHQFDKACRFDEAVRDSSSRGLRHPVYLHRSLIPLRDVSFDTGQERLNYGFRNECSGSCGV